MNGKVIDLASGYKDGRRGQPIPILLMMGNGGGNFERGFANLRNHNGNCSGG